MYNLIKGVLGRKGYELADITKKINAFWVQGILSDEQKEELLTMAQGNASVEASVSIVAKLSELTLKQAELESRVKALENAQSTEDTETEEPTEETYADFVIGKWYYNGDKIAFEGKNYECVAPSGVVCVWSPTDYPAYWSEITE